MVNIVYYGGTSQVFLENENGIQLTADISNKESDTATSIIIGNEMWVSWKAADTLVLTR